MSQITVSTCAQELYQVLERLIALHRNINELLREEYAHMSNLELKGLSEAAHAKEAILVEVWNCEQTRIEAAAKLAAVLKLDPEKTTLREFFAALPPSDSEKLRNAGTALELLVSQAKEANARNMVFAESSIEKIETMNKNVLGLTSNTNQENYSNSGTRQPISEQGGRLLSTKA